MKKSKIIYYMNKMTGEITFIHKKAVDWFSSGANIGVMNMVNNKEVVEWVH